MSLWDQIYQNLIFHNRWLLLVQGLGVSMEITVMAITIGTVLGLLLSMMRMSRIKPLAAFATGYIFVMRGTPVLVQLSIIYYGVFAAARDVEIYIAALAFGLNSAAYVAEIFRAGIQAVDSGQTEAGRSLGLSHRQTMTRVILPQAVKNVLPTYVNEFVTLVKETSVASFIPVVDLMKQSDAIRNATYNAWVPLLAAAVIYLIVTSILAYLFGILERRLRQSDHR